MKSLKTNAILNVLQNICKVLFPLITIPYASRILRPLNYGKINFANSIVRYFILLASLGINTYAQREGPPLRNNFKKINDFSSELFTINFYAMIFSYVGLIILLLCTAKLKNYYIVILIQSTTILLNTIGADWINIIYEDYYYITIRYLILQIISLVLLFAFVKESDDYLLYAFINVIAISGGNFFNIFYIRKYVKLRLVKLSTCIKHLKSIVILFCVSLTSTIYISADVTVLGIYTSDVEVGIYTMASNIYSVIKQIISAVIVVSIPRLAYYLGQKDNNTYFILSQRILNSLIIILLPIIAGVISLSELILQLMGGGEYVIGKNSLIILSFSLFFAIFAGFYANAFLLLAKLDKVYFLSTLISALVNIVLNFILIPIFGIMAAAITTLIAEIIMSVFSLLFTFKKIKLTFERKNFFVSVLGAFLVLIICFIFKRFYMPPIACIISSFLCSCIIYLLILHFIKNPIILYFEEMIYKLLLKKDS